MALKEPVSVLGGFGFPFYIDFWSSVCAAFVKKLPEFALLVLGIDNCRTVNCFIHVWMLGCGTDFEFARSRLTRAE